MEELEKAKLIKDALKIVDELAETYVGKSMDYEDIETLDDLIDKAKKLKKNRLWKL